MSTSMRTLIVSLVTSLTLACGGPAFEMGDVPEGTAGTSGQAGQAGSAGAAGSVGGAAGSTGGQAGSGGEAGAAGSTGGQGGDAGQGGSSGSMGGSSGQGGTGGSAGQAGSGGGSDDPVLLVSGLTKPVAVQADNLGVYYAVEGAEPGANGFVASVPVGGGAIWLIADSLTAVNSLVEQGAYLYWSTKYAVNRAKKDGSDPNMVSQASGALGLAVDTNYAYWSNVDDGSIRKANKEGSGSINLVNGAALAYGVAVDEASDSVFWSSYAAGEVGKVNRIGGSSSVIVSNQDHPTDLVVYDGWVYWTTAGTTFENVINHCTSINGRVLKARLDGTGLQVLADNQACPTSLTVDDGIVYWTNRGTFSSNMTVYDYNGSIYKTSTDGTDTEAVVSGQDMPSAITTNTDSIFWTNEGLFAGQGSVVRLDK